MQDQLSHIQATVASLQALLEGSSPPIPVHHRTVPEVPALAIAEPVTMADLEAWWADAFAELHATVDEILGKGRPAFTSTDRPLICTKEVSGKDTVGTASTSSGPQ